MRAPSRRIRRPSFRTILSFLAWENGQATAAFTGDLLFVNDVGRPEVRDAEADPGALASQLYDSLFNKILALT